MLTVRNGQLAALADERARDFAERMCRHLRHEFPAETAALGDAELRTAVDAALARARAWGLASGEELCRWLNLCACFGWAFDRDPALPWMRAALADAGGGAPGERLHLLYERALHRLETEARNRRLREAFGVG
ncbi:MAG TPA: hypothetical protein VF541_15415 [Longimicrobium sp.]